MKCKNCHQKTEYLDKNDLCEDCSEAFNPDLEFIPVKTRKAGEFKTTRVTQ
jgi:hypothetical protein